MYAKVLTVSICSPIPTKLPPSANFVAPCNQSESLVGSSELKYGYHNSFRKIPGLQRSSRNGCGHVVVNVTCEASKGGNGNDDRFYMRRCVELARKAVGFTSPNPMVGCVIVKDGSIVGEGFHPKAGQPHAEVFALRDAGSMAEGATAYVSLEPCNHYGRTPPCTEALIKAKVKKVVVGMVDPNPIVASKGLGRLRDAGMEVTVGVEEQLCQKLNEAFIHRMLTGKPFVTLRYSISLDGHLLDEVGREGSESGGYYSKLLQENDAVIHSSTRLQENDAVIHSSTRLLAESRHPLVPSSREPGANQPLHILLSVPPMQKTITITEKDGVLSLDMTNLRSILEECEHRGLCSVMVDVRCDSSTEFGRFLKEGFEQSLFQKAVVEVLPVWGGSHHLNSLGQLGLKVKSLTSTVSGDTVLLEAYF
ncbi:unnamed protein product [Cuscuta europaea]|uniref:Riboflavin biosynthesis protein PYRD, chloroplastic n=1 Tax=Cuscuta europaea TaxID=41803 RepID=A0A9P0Z303_CUSEU|nr:unnamed protein product [Cuscuta europaea]